MNVIIVIAWACFVELLEFQPFAISKMFFYVFQLLFYVQPEGWEEDQVELLLFAIYQEVAFKCFGLERSDGYPVLTYVKPFFRKPETEEQMFQRAYVKPFFRKPETEEQMFQRAMEAPHKRELCQACRENLCQVGGRGVPYKIVILNSRNRS